jgi:hypothetical protein
LAVSCNVRQSCSAQRITSFVASHLGDLEEGLGDVYHTAEVLDALNALLDGLGVVGAGGVEDAGDLVDLRLRIAGPGGAGVLSDSPEDGQEGKGDNGLLVDDVELVANSRGRDTGGGRENGGLGGDAVAGEGINERLSLLLGLLLGDVGGIAGRDGDGRDGAERDGGTEASGACIR